MILHDVCPPTVLPLCESRRLNAYAEFHMAAAWKPVHHQRLSRRPQRLRLCWDMLEMSLDWKSSAGGQWKCLCYHSRCGRCTLDTLQRWLIYTHPTQPSATTHAANQTCPDAKLLKSNRWGQKTTGNDSTIGRFVVGLIDFVSQCFGISIFDS